MTPGIFRVILDDLAIENYGTNICCRYHNIRLTAAARTAESMVLNDDSITNEMLARNIQKASSRTGRRLW